MKLCVAQTRPIVGDIERNLANHKTLIERAASVGAQLIVFPELSLTGYEPTLAARLASSPDDTRFDSLQACSDSQSISICAGTPTRSDGRVQISLLVFQPQQQRLVYSKVHLHPDEEPFFVAGPSSNLLFGNNTDVALAICYEITFAKHAVHAKGRGATSYIASVAKTSDGATTACERMSQIASEHQMFALLANCVGSTSEMECGGGSAAWDQTGRLLAKLDRSSEGLICLDTDRNESSTHIVRCNDK